MSWGIVAGAAATVVGGAISANAAGDAADSAAAGNAAATGEQRRQFDLTRSDYAPYRNVGYGALAQLASAYGIPGFNTQTEDPAAIRARLLPNFQGSSKDGDGVDALLLDRAVEQEIARQRNFQSPTAAQPGGMGHDVSGDEVLRDPGYAFGMQQGQQAIDRKFAASGGRLSGASLKAASRFGTDYGSTKYGEAYQRRQDRLNRLQALAGIGQTSTAGSAAAGQNSANAISGLMSDTGYTNAGARMAQGNIWGNTANSLVAMYGRNKQQPTPYQPGAVDDSGNGWY